jgi:hypothetical protein
MVALSVLDLAVVPDGGTSAGALADTTRLAAHRRAARLCPLLDTTTCHRQHRRPS